MMTLIQEGYGRSSRVGNTGYGQNQGKCYDTKEVGNDEGLFYNH